ncbi:MAG TPA: class I SAM-dependent methyltransferase, partial [Bacteroidia bacterium]|nr:class I SAM-dependent methyltransferase [Bacteroidia bacterium]
AAAICQRVVAVDVSPIMLGRLREKLATTHLGNVEIADAGFLSYEHSGDAPDLIYSRFALHHLPDFWKSIALQRMHTLLRPGGILRLWDVVYNFDPADAERCIEAWIAANVSPDVEGGKVNNFVFPGLINKRWLLKSAAYFSETSVPQLGGATPLG